MARAEERSAPPLGPRGLRVLVTRPTADAAPWLAALGAAGAVPLAYPTIEVTPPSDPGPLDAALAHLSRYRLLVFTSANAARQTAARLPGGRFPPSCPRVAAVGEATARALEAAGAPTPLVPADRRQEGLLALLVESHPTLIDEGARVLFPQAAGGRDLLATALAARGCIVDVVTASETRPLPALPPTPPFDAAIFASPSAFDAFVAAHGTGPFAGKVVVTIGPTTAAATAAYDIPTFVAASPDIGAVIAAIATARTKET